MSAAHNYDLKVIFDRGGEVVVKDVRAIRIAPEYATIHLWSGSTNKYEFFHTHGTRNIRLERSIGEAE